MEAGAGGAQGWTDLDDMPTELDDMMGREGVGEPSGVCETSLNFDDVLERSYQRAGGLSSGQKTGILICALANTVDALEVMSLSYVLPQLSGRYESWVQGSLSAAVFGGMLLGGLAGGVLSDSIGRRPVMIASMALNAAFSLLFSLTTNASAMVVVRCLTGFGIGAAVPVLFCVAAELSPARARGAIISFVASFWVVGSVCAAALGWLVIPRYGWRLYAALTAAPALACSAISVRFLQVPVHLHIFGRRREWGEECV